MLLSKRLFVLGEQFFFFFFSVNVKEARAHVMRFDATFGACPGYSVIKILCLTPFSNARQTKYMVTIWQYSKTMLAARRLLCNHFKTNAARFVFRSCHSKRMLHVFFHYRHTFLTEKETSIFAQL